MNFSKSYLLTRFRQRKKFKINWSIEEIRLALLLAHLIATYRGAGIQQLSQDDWYKIATCLPGRSTEDCFFKILSLQKKSVKEFKWQAEQDKILLDLIKIPETVDWTYVAKQLFKRNPNSNKVYRSGKQCREHFYCHIDPNIKKQPWTAEEDQRLLELHQSLGRRWYQISKLLQGRNQNSIKNRFSIICKENIKKYKKQVSIEEHLAEMENRQSTLLPQTRLIQPSYTPETRVVNPHSNILLSLFSNNTSGVSYKLQENLASCVQGFSSLSISIDSKYPFPSSIDDISEHLFKSCQLQKIEYLSNQVFSGDSNQFLKYE